MLLLRLAVVPCAALLACSSEPEPAFNPGERITVLSVGDTLPALAQPAAYGGLLPCPNCPGIETLLVLHPDGTYRLRERYRDRDEVPTAQLGRWVYHADSVPRIELRDSDSPRHFAVAGLLTLRALDATGKPIATDEPLNLVRVSAPPVLGGTLKLRGEFRYVADAATLVSCDGGRLFPVTGDSAFIRLQRAYAENVLGDLAAVLVDIEGRLEQRPGMEEGTMVETFVVDSFTIRERSDECASTRTLALIAVGDWQLGALDGEPLPELSPALQPTLRFVTNEMSISGNAGCNRFTGRGVLRGLDLLPTALTITRRMCADAAANAREWRYAQVLSDGGWFRTEGTELVLSKGGVERARFWRR